MSKWLQRFIAAVLLLTFQLGLPVQIQIQIQNNEVVRSVFNMELIRAAEAADGEESFMSRCGNFGLILFMLAAFFIPGCMPIMLGILFAGVVIYAAVAYLFTGDKQYKLLK